MRLPFPRGQYVCALTSKAARYGSASLLNEGYPSKLGGDSCVTMSITPVTVGSGAVSSIVTLRVRCKVCGGSAAYTP
jgi:hypothetical protein